MHVRHPVFLVAIPIAICLSLLATPVAAELRVSLIDGRQFAAETVSIDASGNVTATGQSESISIGDLERIERAPVQLTDAKVLIDLVGGGRLRGKAVSIADDACMVETAFGSKLPIPLEAVRAVRFNLNLQDDTFNAAVAKPAADSDRLFIQVGDQRQSLSGLVESLDAQQVTFEWQGKQRSAPLKQFYGIAFAQAPESGEPPPLTLELVDGSTIIGQLAELSGEAVQVKVAGTKLTIPSPSIGRLIFRSDRLKHLSAWEDIAASESTIVAFPRKFQRDRNVLGKPLKLADKTYAKGIGVHANSRLVFDLNREFDQFVAVIGIDAVTKGKGDCLFRIELDGTEVYSKKFTGGDEPAALRIDVAAAREMTLIVEAGAGLDLADIADWADAKLIRPAR